MDTEFHYWITGIVAHAAGFTEEEARIIAYASEYVDENDLQVRVEDRATGVGYENFISQTMNILKPKRELMRIYPIFHFVPGDYGAPSARRRDGKMHLLNTTPDSPLANEFLDAAFAANEDTRLYRIGIATHAFADTWAHQNFVGWYDYFNNIGLDPKPDIGHADAEHHPDWPGHRWLDSRLVDGELNNTHRYLSAAERLFHRYTAHLSAQGRRPSRSSWPELQSNLEAAMGRSFSGNRNWYAEERDEAYRKLAGAWLPDFDERSWFDFAIDTKVRGIRDPGPKLLQRFTLFQDDYYWREDVVREETDWFRFQAAVKEHERFAIGSMSDLFEQMNVPLADS